VNTGYALPNEWQLARERLDMLEAAHDAASIRRASALGVGPGMRCLEAGAGGGSFARWLAARGAEVVAADMDVRLLEGFDELDLWQMDLVRDEIPREAFDFIHTRMVLIHIPEREAVLGRLVGGLRPGGLLMLEEDDIHPVLSLATGAYREAWLAFWEHMRAAGVDAEWARGLPARLGQLGLADVGAEIDGQIFTGGSAAARMWSMTWLQALPDETSAGRAALEDFTTWFHGPAKVVAWGRRPT
jgi:SAM-dependent methyltransferase